MFEPCLLFRLFLNLGAQGTGCLAQACVPGRPFITVHRARSPSLSRRPDGWASGRNSPVERVPGDPPLRAGGSVLQGHPRPRPLRAPAAGNLTALSGNLSKPPHMAPGNLEVLAMNNHLFPGDGRYDGFMAMDMRGRAFRCPSPPALNSPRQRVLSLPPPPPSQTGTGSGRGGSRPEATRQEAGLSLWSLW